MAGAAENSEKLDLLASNHLSARDKREDLAVKDMAAQLFGRGEDVGSVARKMYKWLVPDASLRTEDRVRKSRNLLRTWRNQLEFRNLMWNYSVAQLDLETPNILNGVARKARGGRVDAAKLALEITGRHSSKPDVQPASVTLQIGGIPRPREISAAMDGQEETIEVPPEEIGE